MLWFDLGKITTWLESKKDHFLFASQKFWMPALYSMQSTFFPW